MTALTQYERLEATGLWRPNPQEQRREVYVSIGKATLTISNFHNQALTHWSLAAIERADPNSMPAIYHPDGDPDETLELSENEAEMIEAIERLRRAVDRARPRPGRLRGLGGAATVICMIAAATLWLPGAMMRHTLNVVPDIRRQDIGEAMLGRLERVSGRACRSAETQPVLKRLARELGVRRIVILPAGVRDSLHLPGDIVVLNKALVEDYEDPAVAAGYVLAEKTRAEHLDPLQELLEESGVVASFHLLTTGELTQEILDGYSERIVVAPKTPLPQDALLENFAEAKLSTKPYAYAVDVTGETTIGLIEADPLAGKAQTSLMKDRDWVLLQGICGG